jgi:Flp pilus assembly protein TadD
MEHIRKAVRLRPDDGHIVDSLGWAHYRLGNYREAVRYLERAVELMPQDPILNDHLGDAYWRVGRRREARFQWSQALTLNPEQEDIDKIKSKLAEGLPARVQPRTAKRPNQQARGDAQRKKRTDNQVGPASQQLR